MPVKNIFADLAEQFLSLDEELAKGLGLSKQPKKSATPFLDYQIQKTPPEPPPEPVQPGTKMVDGKLRPVTSDGSRYWVEEEKAWKPVPGTEQPTTLGLTKTQRISTMQTPGILETYTKRRRAEAPPIEKATITPIKGIGLSAQDIVGIAAFTYIGFQAAKVGWTALVNLGLNKAITSWEKSTVATGNAIKLDLETRANLLFTLRNRMSAKWLTNEAIKGFLNKTKTGFKISPEAAQNVNNEIQSLVTQEAQTFIPKGTQTGAMAFGGKFKPPPPPQIPPPEGEVPKVPAKEPWQMTSQEWESLSQAERVKFPSTGAPQSATNFHFIEVQQALRRGEAVPEEVIASFGDLPSHWSEANARRLLEHARAEGKPVPPEVLKDYPELVKTAKPVAPEVTKQPITKPSMTLDEFKNWDFKVPEGGSSKTPKTVLNWAKDQYETLADLAKSSDTFRFNEVLGKGWEKTSGIPNSLNLIDKIKSGEKITIYRASDVGDIIPGSYVSESLKYVQEHGERSIPGGKFKVYKLEVYPDELMTYDDPHEFIYIPRDVQAEYTRLVEKGIITKPVAIPTAEPVTPEVAKLNLIQQEADRLATIQKSPEYKKAQADWQEARGKYGLHAKATLIARDKLLNLTTPARIVKVPLEPAIPKAEVGFPEAGLQPSMLEEVPIEVRPQGKGKVTQISMDEQLKLDQMKAYQNQQEVQGLQDYLSSEPASKLTNLIKKTGWYKGEVQNLTLKQYRDLTGKTDIKPNILTPDKKHVRWEYALDDIATELGYPDGESLKVAIEKVGETMAKIKELAKVPPVVPEAPIKPVETVLPPTPQEGIQPPPIVPPANVPPAGGVPPVQPPVPPSPPPRNIPTIPSLPPQGVSDALAQAKAIVLRDKPGIITLIIDRSPGAKQVQRAVHPSLGMKDNMIEAWVGKGHTQATVSNTLHAELLPTLKQLDAAFGEGAIEGAKTQLQFTGRSIERVPFIGTLYDVMQRPQLYDLTPRQRTLLSEIQTNKSALFNKYRDLYGLDIGEFPTPAGAVHLPNVDVSETGILTAGSEGAALRRGRAKERFYETGADRYLHDKALADKGQLKTEDVFNPNLNVGALLSADNETLAAMGGQNVFKTGLGGKTKLELMQVTHPELYAKMTALKKRLESLRGTAGRLNEKQQGVIDDFLNSAYSDADLTQLSVDIMPTLTRGKNAGKDILAINKEISGIKAQITALRPAWATANPRGYTLVQEGGLYRYFSADDAKQIRRLTQVSTSKLLRAADEVRATAFGGDLSPGTIQGLNAWLFDTVGVSKTIGKEFGLAVSEHKILRTWLTDTLAADVRANPESWQRFTLATGLNPLGMYQREEFGTGYIARIPKVGKKWAEANDALFRGLINISKDSFDSIYEAGIKAGKTPEMAVAIAGDDVTKLIPSYSYRRLGMSQAESARYRAALTSVSFLTQPAALMSDAVKGTIKLGTFQIPTASESYAMKRVLTLAALVSSISAISGAIYAYNHKKDPAKAALAAITPGDPYFWSLVLPNGDRIGLGGPVRSILRAVVPGDVQGVPIPLPFAGFYRFVMNKMHPAIRMVYDQIRNKDYFGKTIRSGDFPVNVLQGLEYAFEGTIPLTAGSALEDIRRGESKQMVGDVLSQFAGVNLAPQDKIWDLQREWEKTKDFDAYNDIPTNNIDRLAKLKTAKTPQERTLFSQTREKYRETHPDVDAKLWITGQTTALQSVAGVNAARRIIQENKIDPTTIDAVQAFLKEQEKRKQAGVRDTNITLTERFIMQLTASGQPIAQTNAQPQTNLQKWDTIRSLGGKPVLVAFNKVWYEGTPLTTAEESQLQTIFKQYPFGQTNYETWKKQTVRQLFENSLLGK